MIDNAKHHFRGLVRGTQADEQLASLCSEVCHSIVKASGIVAELSYYCSVAREWKNMPGMSAKVRNIVPDYIYSALDQWEAVVDSYIARIAAHSEYRRVALMYVGVLQDVLRCARSMLLNVRTVCDTADGNAADAVADVRVVPVPRCSVCGKEATADGPLYGATARMFVQRMAHIPANGEELYCGDCLVYFWDMLRWLDIHPDEFVFPKPCCLCAKQFFEECDAKQRGRFS